MREDDHQVPSTPKNGTRARSGGELERLEALFHAAAELAPGERAEFLDRRAPEARVRRKLEAMLADLDSGQTLERPTPSHGRLGPGSDPGSLESALGSVDAHVMAGESALGPGTVLGRYRLLEALGEGGFGIVYRAEQQAPVRRQVAIKILKAGMGTREVVARFEAERQALALMDHPSIATVFDGGVLGSATGSTLDHDPDGSALDDDPDRGRRPSAAGRPYLVMELVRGLPITDYCHREGLDLAARIELFLAVCDAVQHAHQKGVIHRDLKPSNVLVTIQDGRPVPKVIDFGVAKAMHGRLTDKTLFTAYHHLVGTPAYMSPEQAEMSALDIDTRSDVYSLGVLLYELLTGSTPFPARDLARAGLPEIQRILREERPPRPSNRVASRSQGSTGDGSGEATELARHLRGDLDWIVMKALEKERGRRYGTANELADDLRRHLRHEPVLAGPPSRTYRLRKLLSRHRALVVAGLLLVLALAGGIVGTSIGLYEASKQRDAARHEAERARAVTDFLVGTLSLADLEEALDPELSVRRLLDRAAAQADHVFERQPVAEARVRSTLGRAYESLNEHALAERHLRRAIELSDRLREGGDAVAGGTIDGGTIDGGTIDRGTVDGGALQGLELYDTLWALTHVLFKLERPDAQGIAQRARVVALELIRDLDSEIAELLEAFVAAIRSGVHTPDAEPVERALDLLDRAMALAEQRLAPGHPLWPVLADTCMDGAYTLWYTPHEAEAETMIEHVLRIRRRELPPSHPDTGEAVSVLAGVLARSGRAEEAEGRLREAVDELEEVFAEDSFQVAFARSVLGENLASQGRFEEAEPLLVEGHQVLLQVSDDPATFFPIDSYSRVIRLYDAWGREDRARPYRLELAELLATAHWPLSWTFAKVILGPAEAELFELVEQFDAVLGGYSFAVEPGEVDAAALVPELDRLFALRARSLDDDDPRARALGRSFLVWTHALPAGELRRRLLEEVVSLLDPWAETVPLDAAEAHAALTAEDLDDPQARLDHALQLMALFTEEDAWYTANLKARIARALVEHGRAREAEPILEHSLAVLGVQLGPSNRDYQAVERLLQRARAAS